MILGVVGTHNELEVMRIGLSYVTIDLDANLRKHLLESMRERKHLWSYVRGQGHEPRLPWKRQSERERLPSRRHQRWAWLGIGV